MAFINGSDGGDTLTGTLDGDHIVGGAGNDAINGSNGDDLIEGGDDDDQLTGGVGDDTVLGGDGNDFLSGGPGDDVMDGGAGHDNFFDDNGSGTMIGGSGNDSFEVWTTGNAAETVVVDGGAGDDRLDLLVYGPHLIQADMGDGDDEVDVAGVWGSHVELTLGAGRDIVSIPAFHSTSIGQANVEIMDFETGANGDRIDWLDLLSFVLTGWDQSSSPFASGHVRLVQSGADARLQIDLDGGGDEYVTLLTFRDRQVSDFTFENLDGYSSDGTIPAPLNLQGGDGADLLIGAAGNDLIEGHGEHDRIYGGAGDDLLRGGDALDELLGELGNDRLEGGAGGDNLDGGLGDDLVYGEADDDYLTSIFGNDMLDGGAGDDRFYIRRYIDQADHVTALGGDGSDRIEIISSGASSVIIDGGSGDDVVTFTVLGGDADVTLGAGSDRIVLGGQAAYHLLDEGSILVRDFAAGDGGDVVHFDDFLVGTLYGWQYDNPFGSGFVQLVQSGGDALLQVRGTLGGAFRTIVTFQNVQASTFTTANFDGYPPDGSPVPGLEIAGTPDSDELRGGTGADAIDGLGADDRIYGGAGADSIQGGDGNDVIYGEIGEDEIHGGAGNDWLDGGVGGDQLYGEDGNDVFADYMGPGRMFGGAGDDEFNLTRIEGQEETLEIYGGDDDDVAFLNVRGASHFTLDMGNGDDRVQILALLNGTVSLTLGAGADLITIFQIHPTQPMGMLVVEDFEAGDSGDSLSLIPALGSGLLNWDPDSNPFDSGHLRLVQDGSSAVLQIDRDGGADDLETLITFANSDATFFTEINLGFRPDAIYGTAGADTLGDGPGGVKLAGGAGDDVYVVAHPGDTIVELAGEGSDEVRTALAVYSLAGSANVEKLTATSDFNHDFRGNGGDNVVTGAGGNDFIRLQDGGVDTAIGAGGNDVFLFGAALTSADIVDGGIGNDQVAIQGDYSGGLTLGAGFTSVESFAILPGSDTRFGDTAGNFYDYDLTTVNANVAPGVLMIIDANRLRPGEDFTFNGSAETDGNFFLYGGGGTDTLLGGSNNDTFYFGENGQFGASDHVDGGVSGTDQLGLRGNYTIVFGANQLVSIESIGMVSAQDTRFGALGTSYNYNLTMNDGNLAAGVRMTVDAAPLRPSESLTFNGSAELDGWFRIFGGQGSDTITGSQSADIISGGLGSDNLRGAGGADTFLYRSVADSLLSQRDSILDFSTGDRIDLSQIDAVSGTPANDAFHFIGSAAFSGAAGELRATFYAGNGLWTVSGDVNGDGVADIEFFVTSDHPITGGDFTL